MFLIGALLLLASLAITNTTQAHFLWVYTANGNLQVVFGEGLGPDQARFLDGLSDLKAYKVQDGKRVAVELQKKTEDDLGWFETSLDKSGRVVDAHCPYGVFSRGDKSMLLDYSAKYISINHGQAAKPGTELTLDLVPVFENGQLKISAFFKGYPVKDIEVEVTRLESDTEYATTNESGQALITPASRYLIRGKHVVMEAGELDGKKYSEKRYYCTLVLDTGLDAAAEKTVEEKVAAPQPTVRLKKVEAEFAEFPRGMTSFGATVVGKQVFVIGGKSGKAHSYAKSYQNRDVWSLAFDGNGSDNEWQTVGENLGLQGLSVVGYQGKVFRIGGLEARNKEGEEHDLHSVADFKQFDPVTKKWADLPSLPQGRSSIDACVAGNHVYVVGGWTMGDGDSEWATTMLKFDLDNPAGKWQQVETPFKTRALAVRSHNNQLIVVGGLQQDGGPTNQVHVYDLKTNKWTQGPDIPAEGGIKAFGCSAVSMAGHLLVSTYDGGIYQLAEGNSGWAKVHELKSGRFFHQMLPVGENQFALIGGAHMDTGRHLEVEVFEVSSSAGASIQSK